MSYWWQVVTGRSGWAPEAAIAHRLKSGPCGGCAAPAMPLKQVQLQAARTGDLNLIDEL